MALSTARRNVVALTLLVTGYITLVLLAERYTAALRDVPWNQSIFALAIQLFILGAGSFFAFRGGFWVRTGLTTGVPIVAHAILELFWGSDPAYPYLTMLLAVPYSILFFLGAVFIGGPYQVWRDSRHGDQARTAR
jgi:hypothetical protein